MSDPLARLARLLDDLDAAPVRTCGDLERADRLTVEVAVAMTEVRRRVDELRLQAVEVLAGVVARLALEDVEPDDVAAGGRP